MHNVIFILFFLTTQFVAKAQTADFTYQSTNGLFCTPSTIEFSQTSTGSPIGFIWDFGNGTKDYDENVSVTYKTAGNYRVKLTIIYEDKTLEVIKTVVINPAIKVVLTPDKIDACKPRIINFVATGGGASASYAWDFGDSSGIVITAINQTSHDYTTFGSFPVTVTVTDVSGCEGMASKTIKISNPRIVASASPTAACIPANVNFKSTVTVPANDVVTNYTWDFGDGSPVSSTPSSNNISHPYTVVGIYLPTLTITTKDGCTNTYNYPELTYGTRPVNHVATPEKMVVCGSEDALFFSSAATANRYQWKFGDGITTSVKDTFTRHKYTTLGNKTVSVTPYFNGCPGTTINFQIKVEGVIANYTYANSCNNKKTYSFISTSEGNVSSSLWQFGDSSAIATTIDATHTFPASGQFTTSLIVNDNITGCADTASQTIYTSDPILVNMDSAICKNDSTSFSILNTYSNTSARYTWNILGAKYGPISDPFIKVKSGLLGSFNNFVSINYGAQSCPDTVVLNHSLVTRGPDLKFDIPASTCFKSSFSITNNSQPFIASDSVLLWFWNYGNSKINDTIYQPLPFQYKSAGNYKVQLTAIDINGCVDSLVKTTSVNKFPFLRIVPRSDTICLGQPATITAFSSTNISWTPVNSISCADCDTITVNSAVSTTYYATATTPANCNVTDSVLIKVYTPFTTSVKTSNFSICQGQKVQLDVDPEIYRVSWSPSAGLSDSTIHNPVATPLQSTVYTATLSDSVGCFSSNAIINVKVNPLPVVNAGPDQIVSFNANFTISPSYSNNISKYAWSPLTLINCSNCPNTTGIATYTEDYTIKVTSDSGCTASDNITIFVECKDSNIFLAKAFTPNNDNLNDTYYPITRGIKSILRFLIYNRQGQIMYEAKNFIPNNRSAGWNGTFRGQPQAPGAYVYTMVVNCELGEKITKTGSFILLR